MSKNFSAPMSAPNPASVQTISFVASAIRSASTELLPWAMFANGPQWTNAGPPSSVWRRFGLIASVRRRGHRAGDAEVLGRDRAAVARRGEDHPAEPRPEVGQVGGEGQDRHDLGRDGDDELGLARVAVLAPAEADDDLAQRPVADVEHARPEDVQRVDARARCRGGGGCR